MDVFSKSYLEEVVENQGKLFDYAQDHYQEMDDENCIASYMKSTTSAMIDEGQDYECHMDAESHVHYFLANDHYEK